MSGSATHANGSDHFIPPDVIYCGFTRISPIPRAQYYEKALSPATANEIVLTISILGPDRHNFTASIDKQADLQTLARTVEALLSERHIIVACLIDLGTDNPLRWSDTVDDVLDTDSVVGVIPLSDATLFRTMQMSDTVRPARPSVERSTTAASTITTKSQSAPLPQLEFIQTAPERPTLMSPAGSTYGALGRPAADGGYLIDTALVRRRSDMQKPSLRALRILRPSNGAKRSSSTLPAVEPFAKTYIPPLPSSPIPKAIQSPLSRICSNSISLLAFFRFCTRKKTLCELLYWLDTSTTLISEDYIHRTYMRNDAPLKLNIPREVSTTIEARELLRDGILAYSEKGFERSPEGLRVQQLQSEKEALFRQAAITLSGPGGDERKKFVDLLAKALDPEDTSILSLKERKSLETRHAVLAQVCGQYFPGNQVDTKNYFEYEEEHMTKPERLRLANRRTVYNGLFDRRLSFKQASQNSVTTRSIKRPLLGAAGGFFKPQPSRVSSFATAQIDEVMPMEDSSITGWTDVASESDPKTLHSRISSRTSLLQSQDNTSSWPNGAASPTPSQTSHQTQVASMSSSTDLVEFAETTNGTLSADNRKADLVRRQQKLRNILGASPQEVLDRQGSPQIVGDLRSFGVPRASSPTPSNHSRFTVASHGSRMSLSRAEQDEENERRSQVRRAAKLYAMFGEHTDSPNSVPSYRQRPRSQQSSQTIFSRPPSSASQYDASLARTTSRISATSQRDGEPNTPARKQDSRYMPDRNSGGSRRTFKSFLSKNNKGSPMPPDLLSGFPTPPSAKASPTSPAFRHHLMRGRFGTSLYGSDESIMEELGSDEEDDPEGEAIVADCRTNAKLRHLLGNDAPTSTIS